MSILSRILGNRRAASPRGAAPEPSIPTERNTEAVTDPTDALPFMIRPLEPDDPARLAAIFREAITVLAEGDYDKHQRRAWAGTADARDFQAMLANGETAVAVAFGQPVGFAQLSPADYIAMVYVHPDHAGQGVATLLFQYLEDEARIAGASRLHTHASKTAHRFFKTMGFVGDTPEVVKRNGRKLVRYAMEKKL